MISDHNDDMSAAMDVDMGKPLQEAQGAEIKMLLQDIVNVVKNVHSLSHPF
jgi:acyl-CoA reductase-like NAD-dependent aldehyde dehydrogenase